MADTLEIFGEEYANAPGIKAYDDNGNLLTFIKPSGTKNITSGGTTDVSSYASVSVATGSVALPTASKGTVYNHSISVTPSCNITAGYIVDGGTYYGLGVSVSASEVVSGNLEITENGTNINCTNYATVSVAVPGAVYPSATGVSF